MGLTAQYLRFVADAVFGLVASSRANVVFLPAGGSLLSGGAGQTCAVAACQHIFIWDLRRLCKVKTLAGVDHDVTRLALSPDARCLAAGYADGAVRVFTLATGEVSVTLSGHKSAVTALNYDRDGARLVSGSQDTNVVVWDMIAECGLYRLTGHKGLVTQARFMTSHNVLITSSKDTFVKLWDLDTQHCYRTLVAHRTEVWDFALCRGDSLLVTGSTDNELKVFALRPPPLSDDAPAEKKSRDSEVLEGSTLEEGDEEDFTGVCDGLPRCERVGALLRVGRDRVWSMSVDCTGRVLGAHGKDHTLELFQVQTEAESLKTRQKQTKRAKRKAHEAGLDDDAVTPVPASVEHDLKRLTPMRLSGKLRAFDFLAETPTTVKVVALLHSNTLETCRVDLTAHTGAVTDTTRLSAPGHRGDVRSLSWSADNTAVLSAGGGELKVWNRASLQCVRTLPCGYVLSSLFAPGDRHVVLGCKSGELQLFDLSRGDLLETAAAHDGAVWALAAASDQRGFASGSADHTVKFWDYELLSDNEAGTAQRLSLVHTRTLQMSEDVLCVRHTPDSKLLAVALLDNTVKVLFADTLKFFLSLYGHKLPVLAMDISSDSTLLVTASADRNVKIWGLDFGDCHRSLFAHDDSVMCVQFLPKTHMFYSGGKDRKLKQWDADTFQHIQTLSGHQGEVWALAVSPSGNFLVSASHDKSLRLWEKTEEVIVLDVEREKERDKEQEESVAADSGEAVVAGEAAGEATLAGRRTGETLHATDRLLEAMQLCEELRAPPADEPEADVFTAHAGQHPLLQALSVSDPRDYVMTTLKRIRSAELESALLLVPFAQVAPLLRVLAHSVDRGRHVELACRVLLLLLHVHQGAVTTTPSLRPVVERLRDGATRAVGNLRDVVGFNLAGLGFLRARLEARDEPGFFADATENLRQKRKKQKNKALLKIVV